MSKNGTLIDDLLGEQQLLTPVAIFSRKHERHAVPARAKYYSDLIHSLLRRQASSMRSPSIWTPAQVARRVLPRAII
jgi:hypothetical protein